MKPPFPANEAARLEALRGYDILDTLPEQAYDDIGKLAAHICKTPIALVSLVDADRQWFKSKVGLQVPETPREHAFCARAILEPQDVMVVSDASLDGRFAGNPLVEGDPYIRFYAGAPLVTAGGEALGTICVIDRVPRDLSDDQIEALQALSRQVMAQLELRRSVAELHESAEERQRYVQQLEEFERTLKEANAKLEALSVTDELTGVSNRRAFEARLKEEVGRASRYGSPLSLLMLDVDRFKAYNDEFGHVEGDVVLRAVARLLRENARLSDLVARYGGEEFSVILPNTDRSGALTLAERFRRFVEDAPWPKRAVTVSIGAATADAKAAEGSGLLVLADAALYHSKETGRNRVTHADNLA